MRIRAAITALAIVASIVIAPMSRAEAAPGPPSAPEWWFDSWNVPSLWTQGADGRGILIAEIDSGVNASLPQLAGRILAGTDYGPKGGDGRTDHELDPFGHGTAMASLMVATAGPFGIEGLAPSARILPIAVPLAGTDDAGGDDHLADAIRYAVDHGAKIINMSIGEERDPSSEPLPCSPDEQLAITYAVSKGAIVLAAGGNSATASSPVEDPGVCVGVLSVGAVDSSGQVASFSSRHRYTALVAPGVNIPTLGKIAGTAYHGEGTSQATAIASAAVALVWSKFPELTNKQVLARVFGSLDNPRSSRDPAYGFGEINPYRAITAIVADTASEPIISAVQPFIALQNARGSAAPPAPAPAKTAGAPPGEYGVAAAPGRMTSKVILAAIAAGVALVGLLALLIRARAAKPVQRADHAAQRGLDDRFTDAHTPQHSLPDLDL